MNALKPDLALAMEQESDSLIPGLAQLPWQFRGTVKNHSTLLCSKITHSVKLRL